MKRLALAVCTSLLLASAVVRAAPSEGERSRARSLAYEGQEALEHRDYATAAQRFEQADAIVHAPTLMLGLARAQAGLGKLLAAKASYERIVGEGVPARSPQPWFRALEDAKSELAVLKARVPSLVIKANTPSASVSVDGAGVNPGEPIPTDPGKHTVRGTADGFSAAEVIVDAREGNVATVKLELQPAAAAAPPPPPPPPSSSRRVAGFIIGGFGVAALGVGGLMGAAAIGKHATLVKECPNGRCTTAKAGDDLTSYHNVGLLSTVGFIGGGVLLASGVVLVLTAPKSAPPPDAAIAIGPNGIACFGRF
jgi:PEGA domain